MFVISNQFIFKANFSTGEDSTLGVHLHRKARQFGKRKELSERYETMETRRDELRNTFDVSNLEKVKRILKECRKINQENQQRCLEHEQTYDDFLNAVDELSNKNGLTEEKN